MQSLRSPSRQPVAPISPAASIGRHIRWQIVLALSGILLLATLLGYSTYSITTVLVPDRGGVFREGVVGNPKYLNPLLCDATEVDLDLCTLLYRGLSKIEKDGTVVPDLAAGWTISDGVDYTFRLMPEQFWHDGHPVTADDVLFTIGLLQNPDVFSLPDLTSLWRTVTVEKLDDLTVRFHLTEPFTPFLDYTSIGLLPAHIWQGTPASELATKPLDATPIGNGPLRVVETAADHIRLEPSPYFRGDRPYISALELRFFPDLGSLFTAFEQGEIDGVSHIAAQDMDAAAAREDLELFSAVTSQYVTVLFNLANPDVPFLQEPAVRQALYYALDRDRMAQEVAGGQGILAHSPLLPENWAYNPEIPKYPYDVEKASALLDEAGWIDTDGDRIRDKEGQPLRFLLYTNDDPVHEALVERISTDWRAIGVDAQPTVVSFAGLVSDFLNPRRFDAALISWELSGDPDPYPLWHSTQAAGGGQNYSGWANEEADSIMQEARSITDGAERKKLYQRFQELFAEDLPALMLYYQVYTYGVSDRVHNVQVGSINHPSERFQTFDNWYILTRRVPANQAPAAAPPTPPGATATPSQ